MGRKSEFCSGDCVIKAACLQCQGNAETLIGVAPPRSSLPTPHEYPFRKDRSELAKSEEARRRLSHTGEIACGQPVSRDFAVCCSCYICAGSRARWLASKTLQILRLINREFHLDRIRHRLPLASLASSNHLLSQWLFILRSRECPSSSITVT